LRLGELQLVAGIHSDAETVHKTTYALSGRAVPLGASLRLIDGPLPPHPKALK